MNEYYSFELEREHNKATVEIWKRIITDKGVVTKFFQFWKGRVKNKQYMTKNANQECRIEELFNDLIELEKAKQ